MSQHDLVRGVVAPPTYQRIGPERSSEVELWPRVVRRLTSFLCTSYSEQKFVYM